MANQTTAGSGDRSRRNGSSASLSRPTGLLIASGSSETHLTALSPSEARAAATGQRQTDSETIGADGEGAATHSSPARRRRARKRRAEPGRRLFAFDRGLGVRFVAGADEAGRGCLAGPLVAAAVLFDCDRLHFARRGLLNDLDDSKRHTAERREEIYPAILDAAVKVSVIVRSAATIDCDGLHKTNLAALADALRGVCSREEERCACLVDGFSLPNLAIGHRAIVRGDSRSAAIAAASIVAKVSRDRLMRRVDDLHPGWGFRAHVGYSTPEHREAIGRLGITPFHRRSFESVAYPQLSLD